jgi:hypothetical protein
MVMMGRADGAKIWARVLSELAAVPVIVEWERPAWRVRWRDGPTREALMGRAVALGRYRVAAQLPADQLRFVRTDSAKAIALGWLAQGSPESPGRVSDGMAAVEAFCEDIGYPESRFNDATRGAADLLIRLSGGDSSEMGAMLSRAVRPVPPAALVADQGPALRGQVISYRWPRGGPPEELLGPALAPVAPVSPKVGGETLERSCERCGRPLGDGGRGRPAKFCGGACRTAAHRAARAAAAV